MCEQDRVTFPDTQERIEGDMSESHYYIVTVQAKTEVRSIYASSPENATDYALSAFTELEQSPCGIADGINIWPDDNT